MNGDEGYGPADGVQSQALKGGRGAFCFCFTASMSAAPPRSPQSPRCSSAPGERRARRRSPQRCVGGARDLSARGRDREYGAGLVQAAAALAVGQPPAGAGARPDPGEPGRGRVIAAAVMAALAGALAVLAMRARQRRANA